MSRLILKPQARASFGSGAEYWYTHFEEDLDAFKVAFARNYNSASTNFGKAIDEIDKAIKRMESQKFLTTSENQLRLANNNKLDDVSVKKLTRKIQPWKKFEALKEGEITQNRSLYENLWNDIYIFIYHSCIFQSPIWSF